MKKSLLVKTNFKKIKLIERKNALNKNVFNFRANKSNKKRRRILFK